MIKEVLLKIFNIVKKHPFLALMGLIMVVGIYSDKDEVENNNMVSNDMTKSISKNLEDSSGLLNNNSTVKLEKIKKSNWSYYTDKDEMRNTTDYGVINQSLDKLYFDFPYQGGSITSLIIRKTSRFGKDVFIKIEPGQFSCGLDCTISAKFDDGAVEKFSATGASDGSHNLLFISNYTRFVKKLKNAKKLILEIEFYNQGLHQIKFDIQELKWDY